MSVCDLVPSSKVVTTSALTAFDLSVVGAPEASWKTTSSEATFWLGLVMPVSVEGEA